MCNARLLQYFFYREELRSSCGHAMRVCVCSCFKCGSEPCAAPCCRVAAAVKDCILRGRPTTGIVTGPRRTMDLSLGGAEGHHDDQGGNEGNAVFAGGLKRRSRRRKYLRLKRRINVGKRNQETWLHGILVILGG